MAKSPIAQIANQERVRREIMVKSDLIPPLPDLVVRVLALLRDGSTEPEALEEHLLCDPVLVAKMLGMVNSPFYGMNREIRTVRDAVMVLGFRGVRSLLLASSTAKYLKRDFSCYAHGKDGLWRHSLAVGSAAKALAASFGHRGDADEMFVAGLLHDIGKILLASYLEERGLARTDAAIAAQDMERDAIGIDHAEAGGLVATKWRLSDVVKSTLEHHHGPSAPNEHGPHIAIVRLADAMAHRLGIGYAAGMAPASDPPEEALQDLGINAANFEEVRPDIEEAMQIALDHLDSVLT